MDIKVKNVLDLTPTEYRACYLANYRGTSIMQGDLFRIRSGNPMHSGTAILIWDGPEDTIGSLIGWSLVMPSKTWGDSGISPYAKRKSKHTAMFWVKRQHRRKGYGSILMDEVIKIEPIPFCYPHSKQSAHLFKNRKITADGDSRKWYLNKTYLAS